MHAIAKPTTMILAVRMNEASDVATNFGNRSPNGYCACIAGPKTLTKASLLSDDASSGPPTASDNREAITA